MHFLDVAAACLATGDLLVNFPEECRSELDNLYPKFFANLEDPTPIVRQGAASALSNAVKTYGNLALSVILSHTKKALNVSSCP